MSSTHSIRRLPPQCMPTVIHPPLGLQSPLLAPNPDHCIVMVSSFVLSSPQCGPLVGWGWLVISMPNILPRGAPVHLVCKASGHMCAMLSIAKTSCPAGVLMGEGGCSRGSSEAPRLVTLSGRGFGRDKVASEELPLIRWCPWCWGHQTLLICS